MPGRVAVLETVLDAMRAHARAAMPHECCGLLAGSGGAITDSVAVKNALDSAREFFMEPGELIRALRDFRERGLIHRGIYHSHPVGENFPSPRDVEMAFYPACAYFIISPELPPERQVRAFCIALGNVSELSIETVAG